MFSKIGYFNYILLDFPVCNKDYYLLTIIYSVFNYADLFFQ